VPPQIDVAKQQSLGIDQVAVRAAYPRPLACNLCRSAANILNAGASRPGKVLIEQPARMAHRLQPL